MSRVTYYPLTLSNSEIHGICGFCQDDIGDGRKVVAHEDGGEKHPVHEMCLESSGKWVNVCLICKKKTNLYPLSTRVKLFVKDIFLTFLIILPIFSIKAGLYDINKNDLGQAAFLCVFIITILGLKRINLNNVE